jgi:small subunit ribosomal protein S14
MTSKDWRKTLKQLKAKPVIRDKYIKHNSPKIRTTGAALFKCKRCGRIGGHISKYGLHLCRLCFKDTALSIGFKKYN